MVRSLPYPRLVHLLLLLVTALLPIQSVLSQDLLGGQISASHVSGTTHDFAIHLYSQTDLGVSRASLIVDLGNGQFDTLSGTSVDLPGNLTRWSYTTQHTYPGPGMYEISVVDSFRIPGLQNISNSASESLVLKNTVVIGGFTGSNTNVELNSDPNNYALGGNTLFHDLLPFDPDGDSLAFSLVPTTSSSYSPPPGATIDPQFGVVQMPFNQGIFAINIRIEEYRSGAFIGASHREMVIDFDGITSVTPHSTASNELLVYPNPAQDVLVVEHPDPITQLVVFDLLGNRIIDHFGMNTTRTQLTVGELPKGVYLLEAHRSDQERSVRRFVVK